MVEVSVEACQEGNHNTVGDVAISIGQAVSEPALSKNLRKAGKRLLVLALSLLAVTRSR